MSKPRRTADQKNLPSRFPSRWALAGMAASYALVLLLAHTGGLLLGLVAAGVALTVFHRPVWQLLRFALWEQWVRIDREVRDPSLLKKGFDWRPVVILSMVAVVLTANNYFGHRQHYRYFAARLAATADDAPLLQGASLRNAASHPGVQRVYALRVARRFGPWARIVEFSYWVGWRLLTFFLIPLLVVLLLPGESLRDYGLSLKGTARHLWIYGVLLGIVLPAVIVVSYTPAFKGHYPFPWSGLKLSSPVPGRRLLAWELMYAMQFFALEFFFRGFILNALRRSMGAYAIFAMVVPYCMIHFGKPLPETLGAIAAGLVLGTLALGTRSIWCGFLVHVSVAWSMDIAALLQKGAFPIHW